MPAKATSTYNVLELQLHRNIVQSQGHDTWTGTLFFTREIILT